MDTLSRISLAIASLPPLERLAFRMVHVEGFSEQETAKCAGMTPARIRKINEKAKITLRGQLLDLTEWLNDK